MSLGFSVTVLPRGLGHNGRLATEPTPSLPLQDTGQALRVPAIFSRFPRYPRASSLLLSSVRPPAPLLFRCFPAFTPHSAIHHRGGHDGSHGDPLSCFSQAGAAGSVDNWLP